MLVVKHRRMAATWPSSQVRRPLGIISSRLLASFTQFFSPADSLFCLAGNQKVLELADLAAFARSRSVSIRHVDVLQVVFDHFGAVKYRVEPSLTTLLWIHGPLSNVGFG